MSYVYIIEENYVINRIHEKSFRSDLSTQVKKDSPLTNYLLQIAFSFYLFVLGSFATFFLRWPMMALLLIKLSAFSLCTIF